MSFVLAMAAAFVSLLSIACLAAAIAIRSMRRTTASCMPSGTVFLSEFWWTVVPDVCTPRSDPIKTGNDMAVTTADGTRLNFLGHKIVEPVIAYRGEEGFGLQQGLIYSTSRGRSSVCAGCTGEGWRYSSDREQMTP